MNVAPGWYAIALSRDIEPGTSAGTMLLGRERVVWRDTAGAAHVWEDRCPHRGMRLSFGFVRGNHIACLYHGWQYDTDGQCRLIPAHPEIEIPKVIRATRFPSHEAGGLIWAWTEPGEVPHLSPPAPDADCFPVRSLYLDHPAGAVSAATGAVPGANLSPLRIEGADLLLALQPRDAARSALHILVRGEGDARLAAALAGAKELRRLLNASERGKSGAAA